MTKKSKICQKCNTENPPVANYCRHCGEQFEPTPEIIDFRLNAKCHAGDYVALSWKISNADIVTLNGQDVTGQEDYFIRVTQDTVYTLSATKGEHTISRTMRIHPEMDKRIKKECWQTIKTEDTKKYILYGIIALITIVLSIVMLSLLTFNEEGIQYYLGIGYSDWPIIKITFIIINGLMLIISMNLGYSIIKFFKNNNYA